MFLSQKLTNPLSKETTFGIILFSKYKHGYLTHSSADKAVKGTVVNRPCHSVQEDSLELKINLLIV